MPRSPARPRPAAACLGTGAAPPAGAALTLRGPRGDRHGSPGPRPGRIDARLTDCVRELFFEQGGTCPRFEEVAARLAVSQRTLRRHLRALGTSYRAILRDFRLELAVGWLGESRLSVEEIADRLGYTEASTFRSAFRRWTGFSPRTFRQRCPRETFGSGFQPDAPARDRFREPPSLADPSAGRAPQHMNHALQ